MAAKDYEGTAAAAVSNFQRYYYFNPLSPRQGAAHVPAANSENILHRGNFNCKSALFSFLRSISLRAVYPPHWLWEMRYILRDARCDQIDFISHNMQRNVLCQELLFKINKLPGKMYYNAFAIHINFHELYEPFLTNIFSERTNAFLLSRVFLIAPAH